MYTDEWRFQLGQLHLCVCMPEFFVLKKYWSMVSISIHVLTCMLCDAAVALIKNSTISPPKTSPDIKQCLKHLDRMSISVHSYSIHNNNSIRQAVIQVHDIHRWTQKPSRSKRKSTTKKERNLLHWLSCSESKTHFTNDKFTIDTYDF